MTRLKLYGVLWCPHCRAAMDFLKQNGIEYDYVDMDQASPEVEKLVTDVNGGIDWVVPTLEFSGKWMKGKVFEKETFRRELLELGVDLN